MALSDSQILDQRTGKWAQRSATITAGGGRAHLPAQVDAFLRLLSLAVLRVDVGLVLHHLHPLPPVALLTAVLADHVELADPVLEVQRHDGMGRAREDR